MTIEPHLKYCPRCDDEYREDIEYCVGCKIRLITGADKLARLSDSQKRKEGRGAVITADDDVVRIHRGALLELKHFEELFAAENIANIIEGDERSCGKNCCPSVFYLLVRREDAMDAMVILQKEFKRLTGLDEHEPVSGTDTVFDLHAVEATCPACGCTFSTSITTCPDCGLCLG